MSEEVVDLLQRELDLGDDETYRLRGPPDLGGLWTLHALDRPELKDPVFQRVTQSRLAAAKDGDIDIFAALRPGDILLPHPYDPFRTSVAEETGRAHLCTPT